MLTKEVKVSAVAVFVDELKVAGDICIQLLKKLSVPKLMLLVYKNHG